MEANSAPRLGCLVMAAGNARRFGENKLAAILDGQTLIRRALKAVPPGVFAKITVVSQYAEILELAEQFGFDAVRNPHPDWGISHTIRLGTLAMDDCDAILYMVSDQPLLGCDSVQRVVERWLAQPDRIAGAGHNGVRGNPNIFPAAFYPELLALQEDHGGNQVIRAHEALFTLVEIPQDQLTDCDTPQALDELKKHADL